MKAGGRPVDVGGAVIGATGVVVAGCVDHGDAGIGKPGQFACQDSLGSNGEPLVVEQVAGDQQRVSVFLDGEVDQGGKCLAARVLKALPQRRVVASIGGVEVDVSGVNDAHGRPTSATIRE